MKLLTIAVRSFIVVALLPLLTNAKPVDNNSKPYCNITRYFPRTSIQEVQFVITDAKEKLNDTCYENEVECRSVVNNTTTETDFIALQDMANGKLQFLLGRLQQINGLCKTEELKFYSGDESLNKACNVLKCKTTSVIEKVIEYLLDHKCGCEEGCHYNPGSFIEFTQETTVTVLLQEVYRDLSFLQIITDALEISSKIIESTTPPIYSGSGRDVTM